MVTINNINLRSMRHTNNIRELEERFLNGEKLTKEQIAEDYVDKNSDSKNIATYYITQLQKIFLTSDRWFGRISDFHYGLVDSEEEYRYAQNRYFNSIKSKAVMATKLYTEAVERKLILPSGVHQEKLMLTKALPKSVK